MSIKVSNDALNELKSILAEREINEKIIRLFLSEGGCSGPEFNLTIGEQEDTDIVVPVDDLTFVVSDELVLQFKHFDVEFYNQDGMKGIYVKPEKPLERSCSGCSGGCC